MSTVYILQSTVNNKVYKVGRTEKDVKSRLNAWNNKKSHFKRLRKYYKNDKSTKMMITKVKNMVEFEKWGGPQSYAPAYYAAFAPFIIIETFPEKWKTDGCATEKEIHTYLRICSNDVKNLSGELFYGDNVLKRINEVKQLLYKAIANLKYYKQRKDLTIKYAKKDYNKVGKYFYSTFEDFEKENYKIEYIPLFKLPNKSYLIKQFQEQ